MGKHMRIAVVHSFYASAQPSGENQAVCDQVRALRAAGHEVELFATHTDELNRNRFYALRAAARVALGRGANPLDLLRAHGPEVVHVHNLFPNFGRSWVRQWDGPLVATLHNYRPMCAGANLQHDGAPCTRCPEGDPWAGLRSGCYRGSRVATLPLAWANRHGAQADPVISRADRLIVLSERARQLYLQFGLPSRKLSLVPNFVDAQGIDPTANNEVDAGGSAGRWLFVGRLSEEKGVLPLLRGWPEGERLDVIGAGPLEQDCRATAPKSVRFLGALGREQLLTLLPRYTGLVFPGVCPESAMPLVCQEALAAGVPVLALAGSAAADGVLSEGTGAVYQRSDKLPDALAAARESFPALRRRCRQVHAERYTPEAWAMAMVTVYAQVLRDAVRP